MMPWYIHTIERLYDPRVQTKMPDGSWRMVVSEPYTSGSLIAAWWVLTGKAYAFTWPRTGDLEKTIGISTNMPKPPKPLTNPGATP